LETLHSKLDRFCTVDYHRSLTIGLIENRLESPGSNSEYLMLLSILGDRTYWKRIRPIDKLTVIIALTDPWRSDLLEIYLLGRLLLGRFSTPLTDPQRSDLLETFKYGV
jgi:hypothetical protein